MEETKGIDTFIESIRSNGASRTKSEATLEHLFVNSEVMYGALQEMVKCNEDMARGMMQLEASVNQRMERADSTLKAMLCIVRINEHLQKGLSAEEKLARIEREVGALMDAVLKS